METKKVSTWISRASNLSAQLNRSPITPIETIMFLRAGRECASEISAFLLQKMVKNSSDQSPDCFSQEDKRAIRSSDEQGARFVDILRLQDAKNQLVRAINAAALVEQREHASTTSSISKLVLGGRYRGGSANTEGLKQRQSSSDEELHTLMRVRGLLAAENMKMDQVVASISEGSVALRTLHAKLEEVDAKLTFTQTLVRGMLRVKTLDDVLLRLSWVLFFVVVFFVWSQRIFGFGAVRVL
jgi:hypothetical protein